MKLRWRAFLPTFGLAVFSLMTYVSWDVHRQAHHRHLFFWGTIQLDSDPLNERDVIPVQCPGGSEPCVPFSHPIVVWAHPGLLEYILTLSALPAFIVGMTIVRFLSRLGVNEITSFMTAMPLLIFGWLYFVGRLLDRRSAKRRARTSQLETVEPAG
jgi:hypothetical protein